MNLGLVTYFQSKKNHVKERNSIVKTRSKNLLILIKNSIHFQIKKYCIKQSMHTKLALIHRLKSDPNTK